jgi:acetylornithine deacetylase
LTTDLPSLISELVAVDSTNTFFGSGAAGEAALAEFVAGHCHRLGLPVELREALPGRPNVWAHLDAPEARSRLLLNAHLDTVPAGDMPRAFTPRIESGRLYGRGSCDDKGPMAAMLVALERLMARRRELRTSVTFVATIDEEYSGAGMRAVAASGERFDGAVVAEGTDLGPVIAHRGSARLNVRVRGRAAHSSRPELGENAIVRMAEVIAHLDQHYTPALAQRRHPLAGPASAAITLIQGGTGQNVIPAECVITIKRRAIPGETIGSVQAELEAALDELRRQRPDLKIDPAEEDGWGHPLDSPPDSAVAQAALEAVRAVTGRGEFCGAPWGSDAATLFHGAGVPCVVLGPDSAVLQGHTANESVSLEQVEQSARIYEELALRFGRRLAIRRALPSSPSPRVTSS